MNVPGVAKYRGAEKGGILLQEAKPRTDPEDEPPKMSRQDGADEAPVGPGEGPQRDIIYRVALVGAAVLPALCFAAHGCSLQELLVL